MVLKEGKLQKQVMSSAVKNNQDTSFNPVQLRKAAAAPGPAASPQTMQAISKEVAPATTTTNVVSGQGKTKEIYLEHHHHHHYHHIHHHRDLHGLQQHQPSQPSMDSGMNIGCSAMARPTPQTRISVPVDGHSANYSMNASNFGSIGQNEGSINPHVGGVNVETANIVAEKNEALNGNGTGSGSGSHNGAYQDSLAQRKAALNKFRQKREKRNFNKKVNLFLVAVVSYEIHNVDGLIYKIVQFSTTIILVKHLSVSF
jgi:hypothetical protein